jgi:hypothetical protein
MVVNRYNRANPAKDTYFNSFVPLPLDQLTALGMSKKQDLEKNQALLDKAYNDALDIKYIKESPAEEANYRGLQKGMTDLALKYSTVDLTNPIEMSNMRRELRSVADPTLIKRMEESFVNNQQYKALMMDMKSKGTWNDLLNESKAPRHDSKTGVYNELPEAYFGREKLLDPYFKDLKPSYKGISNEGMLIMSVDDNDISRIANPQRAQELISTPAGQQEIRLFKKSYPSLAEGRSDIDIMNVIMRDYAEQKKQVIADPLSGEMFKAWNAGNKPPAGSDELRGDRGASVQSFKNPTDVKTLIKEKLDAGDKEGAKDLRLAMEQAAKKYGIDLTDFPDERKFLDGQGAGAWLEKIGLFPSRNDQDKVNKFLEEISSTMSTQYSFGFPTYNSGGLSQTVDPNTGEKLGTADLSYISTNMITNPGAYELNSINGGKVPKNKTLKGILSGVGIKDLVDIEIGVTGKAANDFKPEAIFSYQDEKNKVTKIGVLINNPTQWKAIAKTLFNRGDVSAATAVLQPHIAQTIATDDFDKEQTYKVVNRNGVEESLIRIKRDNVDLNAFRIKFDYQDQLGNTKTADETAINRQDLTAKIYDLVGRSGGTFEK